MPRAKKGTDVAKRNFDILCRVEEGETYTSVARHYDLSRERVRLIVSTYRTIESEYVATRTERKRKANEIRELLHRVPPLPIRTVISQAGCDYNTVRQIDQQEGTAWMRLPFAGRGLQPWDYNIVDGCWIWIRGATGARPNLYPRVQNENGKTEYTHRYLYRQIYGEIPDGKRVYRACGNQMCVRPEHLTLRGS